MNSPRSIRWSRRRGVRRRSIFILLGLVALLEIVLRLLLPLPVPTYYYGLAGEIWDEDPELFWIPRRHYADEIRRLREADPARLVYAFGGSILTNHRADTNFPDELVRLLPESYTVVNFATGGYSSYQTLVNYQRMRALRVPALVLAGFGYNDRDVAKASDVDMALHNQRFSVKTLRFLSRSKIVQVWRRLLWQATGYDPYAMNPSHPDFVRRVDLPNFNRNLRELADLTARDGTRLVLVAEANLDPAVRRDLDPYFAAMEKLAAERPHVYFFDPRPVVFGRYLEKLGAIPGYPTERPETLLLHVDACHYNNEGHRLIAGALAAFLKENDLL